MGQTDGANAVERSGFRPRRPALLAFIVIAAGMVLDRYCDVGMTIWLTLAVCCLPLLLFAGPSTQRTRSVALCLLLISVGAARHHLFWSVRPLDNIATLAQHEPALIRLRGQALAEPEIRPAEHSATIPDWMQLDQTVVPVRCLQVNDQGTWHDISGNVRLSVSGHLRGVQAGDELDLTGVISLPQPPQNPGDIDYRDYLRAQELDAVVMVNHPLAVTSVQPHKGVWWSLINWRNGFRRTCDQAMTRHLSLKVQPIASSLLFGDRTRIDHELRTQFAETGAMHLLAISGLHVGILLGAFFLVCRWLNTSVTSTTVLLISLAIGYAFVTNARPPILRAVLLVVMSLSAQFAHRRVDGLNALAATAAILVLYRPADLFDIGAQLSFLAVWAILVVSPKFMRQMERSMSRDLPQEEPALLTFVRDWGQRILMMFVITLAILVATAPVTMSRFHLITPVGLLGNLILLPLTALTLVLGFLFVACCLLLPTIVPWMAIPFNWSLNLLYGCVQWCGRLPGGHMYVPGVPLWWLVGFYVCLVLWWNPWRRKSASRWGWRGMTLWCVLGLSLALWPARRDNLRCTFISVGHGNAVLLELPDGTNILSDGGTFGLGRNATRQIENVLWSRGISRVDAVVISHADVDHFNGVPYLLEHISVGTVFLSPTFVDLDQRSVAEFFDATTAANVPFRFVHSGDDFQAQRAGETNCHVRVLHPPLDWHDEDDNANSVVLAVEYGGRRLLLTGDIEDAGQGKLIESVAGPFDVVLAPHHGSKASNPPEFYNWAHAELVFVSTNDAAVRNRLRDVIGQSELLTTAEAGAITVTVAPDGEMTVESFLKQE